MEIRKLAVRHRSRSLDYAELVISRSCFVTGQNAVAQLLVLFGDVPVAAVVVVCFSSLLLQQRPLIK